MQIKSNSQVSEAIIHSSLKFLNPATIILVFSGYHYSCVLYLSTQGVDFEGGDFVFNDPAEDGYEPSDEEKTALQSMTIEEQMRRSGRKLTPFHPSRGAAVIFSSGWENMHEVEKIT